MKMLYRLSGKLLLIVTVGCGLIVFAHELELYLPDIEQWVQTLGPWAPLTFIGLFTL